MKSFTLMVLMVALGLVLSTQDAQAQKVPKVDKSPLDVATMKADGGVAAKVYYSRPAKKGRQLFGDLVPYGKVWRTGANEATEITFYKDVNIGGKTLKAGTYALFTIPEKESWTVIFNSDLHQWGAYRYKDDNDVLRASATVGKTKEDVENFSIMFSKSSLIFAWGDTKATLEVEVK